MAKKKKKPPLEEVGMEEQTSPETSESDEETGSEEQPDLEEKIAELQDQLIRKAAEFENFKRRKDKEFIQLIQSANEQLVTSLLNVLDDLDRTLAQEKEKLTVDSLLEGVQLVHKQFLKTLQDTGLKAMDCVGRDFDAELHDALMQMESGEENIDRVVQEFQKGYFLNDKVIRHAKVVVGK